MKGSQFSKLWRSSLQAARRGHSEATLRVVHPDHDSPQGSIAAAPFLRFSGSLSSGAARRIVIDDSAGEGAKKHPGESHTVESARPQDTSAPQNSAEPEPAVPLSMLRRTGFAYMRTLDGIEGAQFDLEPYDSLLFHARGDGGALIASIRTDSWVCGPGEAPEHTWQAAVVVPRGTRWSKVEVPLSTFVRTWKGRILPEQQEMNRRKVVGFGVASCIMNSSLESSSKLVRREGPFSLDLLSIKAIRN